MIVFGVNDVVNLIVCEDFNSLIVGMLIFDVDKVCIVVVIKCLLLFGFVGIFNFFFVVDNLLMLFVDGK